MVSASFIIFVSLLGLSGVYSNVADFDCFERPDSGPGRAYFEVYAWQPRDKTCTKFVYGGLLGNRNRFETIEECQRSCHDAVLRKQLTFNPTRRYNAVNRLHETFQFAVNVIQVDNGYFRLAVPDTSKALSLTTQNQTPSVEAQESNGDEAQHWDIIPTGEKDYYRIKTRSKSGGHIDYLFLEVPDKDPAHVSLARREDAYLGQQWRFV